MTMRQLAAATLAAVFSISGLGAVLISQQSPRPVEAVELHGDDPAIRRDDDDPARLEVDGRDDDDWTSDPTDDVAGDTSGAGQETGSSSAGQSAANSVSIDQPSAGDTSASVEPAAEPVQNVAPAPAVNDASVSHDDSVSVDSVSSASDD
jgi:hypothetical protein